MWIGSSYPPMVAIPSQRVLAMRFAPQDSLRTLQEPLIGNRLLFPMGVNQRLNVWEIPLEPGLWHVARASASIGLLGPTWRFPRASTRQGVVAIQSVRQSMDFYLMPIDFTTGQASGPVRRLTQDSRPKVLVAPLGGHPGLVYFGIYNLNRGGEELTMFSIDLHSSRQAELNYFRLFHHARDFAGRPSDSLFAAGRGAVYGKRRRVGRPPRDRPFALPKVWFSSRILTRWPVSDRLSGDESDSESEVEIFLRIAGSALRVNRFPGSGTHWNQ